MKFSALAVASVCEGHIFQLTCASEFKEPDINEAFHAKWIKR